MRLGLSDGRYAMLFRFTLSVPSREGQLVHQVVGEHPAQSLDALAKAIADTEFFIVEEIYRNPDRSNGCIVLNSSYVAKIKVETNSRQ